MSDLVEADVDAREFERALVRFQSETQLGWPEVIRMQARLLVVRLIEWTPPFGMGKDAQKKGKAAVEGDIRRVFIPFKQVPFLVKEIADQRIESLAAETDFGGVRFNAPGLQRAWERRDWDALRIIFERSAEAKARKFVFQRVPDPMTHQAARVNGRVKKRRTPNVAIERESALKAYIRQVQQRVGQAKAGWVVAARLLAAKFPAWILGAGTELGSVRDETSSPNNPQITVSNEVPYASDIFPDGKQSELLATRVRDMTVNAQRFVEARARRAGL
jgi:hypothetical protein